MEGQVEYPKSIQCYFTNKQHRYISEYVSQKGISMSEFIRSLVEEKIAQERRKEIANARAQYSFKLRPVKKRKAHVDRITSGEVEYLKELVGERR